MTDREVRAALSDDQIVALTVFGEARNQSLDGMAAVAWVITNRMKRRGHSLRRVCLSPWQFSCWQASGGEANYKRVMDIARRLATGRSLLRRDRQTRSECAFISSGVTNGAIHDVSRGADHYLTRKLYAERPPKWVKGQKVCAAIGDHVFFDLEGA